jgi:hypothetical protein
MYQSLLLHWSPTPSEAETLYRNAGLVRTAGTVFFLPPNLDTLRTTYNAPPRPQTRMSSGAVALCKHFERSGSVEHRVAHPFWTLPKGSNEEKTRIAAEILEAMLRDAVWRNVMMLHEGVAVYEIRNGKGYGMRWTLELATAGSAKTEVNAGEPDPGKDPTAEDAGVKSVDEPKINKVTFRGFLEPIAGLDHELDFGERVEVS